MDKQQMRVRTKRFAIDIINLCKDLPKTEEHWMISRQLMRSGSSVGANYRASLRGRSKAEFIAKLGIVEEEADESQFFPELLEEFGGSDESERARLWQEADEILAIIVSTIKSTRGHK
ncbi:MAG: four helix bundle protein [Bacteroidetes bacterium]|nr:four helix bundle protein [Bacteroidota bacterium]